LLPPGDVILIWWSQINYN